MKNIEILKCRKLDNYHSNDFFSELFARAKKSVVKTLTGIPPLTFTADGTPLLDYLITGNTTQSGTPTPESPVMPQGTGDKTANLFDSSSITLVPVSTSATRSGTNLGILPQGDYVLSATATAGATQLYRTIKDGNNYTFETIKELPYTFTADGTSEQIIRTSGSNFTSWASAGYTNIMLNSGSTALPYEPFGIKIPISSADTTTNNYLGEVETTRKIQKLVLDGTENWNEGTSNYYIFINVSGRGEGIPNSTALSTHTESGVVVNNNGTALFFKKSVFVHSSLADFKTYLQQQYAAGTPVVVWYVLATETTGIVNEPLMRIGDYADTLSKTQAGVTIPTNNGSTTVDVDTTVKPSEMYIKYMG